MLGIWRSHAEYQLFLINNLLQFYINNKITVEFYSKALTKLYILDLDILKALLKPRFSTTGKPSNQQPEIFRSFILMSELHYNSITNWIAFLKANPVLCFAVGVNPSNVPGVGSHYDFINRLWLENSDVEQERQNSLHPFKSKPRKKFGNNQKQPPRHPGIIKKFVDLALQGKSFESRPERLLQQIFAKVAVEPSAHAGLLGDTTKLTISGDGTCINTGGVPTGLKFVIVFLKAFTIVTATEDSLTRMLVTVGIVITKFGIMDTVVIFYLSIIQNLKRIYPYTYG
jgi:hypothetical protein